MFQLLPIEEANGFHGEAGSRGGLVLGGLFFLCPDFFQFTRVEPVTGALRAMIHFHAHLGIEKLALEFDACAPGAIALALKINDERRITLQMQHLVAGHFALFIHTLEFKRIKPDAGAATFAGIHGHAPNGELG